MEVTLFPLPDSPTTPRISPGLTEKLMPRTACTSPLLVSLGTMCNDATQNLRTCPYQLFIPALVICLIMFGFNFIGDGLRDALDPKLKK